MDDFMSCVLSTVAARLQAGQRFSFLCTSILIGGEDQDTFHFLHRKLLHELMANSWVMSSELEACMAEAKPIVQQHRRAAALTYETFCPFLPRKVVYVLGGICKKSKYGAQ